jgi:glycosyltransferase involved in cell wall biosynthesis
MSDVKLNVLLTLNNLYIGGSQESVRTLAKYLSSDRCTPVICALFDGGPLCDDLVEQGLNVEVLHLRRRPFLAFPWYVVDMIRLWRFLARIISKYKINVVQTYILGSQHFHVLALARLMGVPIVILNFRNEKFLPFSHDKGLKNRIHRLAYRLARRWASDYVAVSAEVKQAMMRLLGLQEDEVTVVCNGVDIDIYRRSVDRDQVRRQLDIDREARILLTVATLKTQKGHCYLIDAAVEVIRQYRDIHFLFVGDGDLRPELQTQVDARCISDRIHFLGDRRDVSTILAVSDIFVLPSLWEGLSMALLEAMASAKPIVATDVSGTDQVMIHNETGILVSPGDSDALIQAIGDLLSNPLRAKKLGEAAQQRVETMFGAKLQAQEYLALYRRLMVQQSTRAVDKAREGKL